MLAQQAIRYAVNLHNNVMTRSFVWNSGVKIETNIVVITNIISMTGSMRNEWTKFIRCCYDFKK